MNERLLQPQKQDRTQAVSLRCKIMQIKRKNPQVSFLEGFFPYYIVAHI